MSDPTTGVIEPDPTPSTSDSTTSGKSLAAERDATQSTAEAKDSAYRPELDGVRAIAVALVILFHLGLGWMPGGFIGVDVFFVLSGYLITTLLVNDLSRHGRVRFGRFYARRARRLLPAAAFTLGVVITAARFLLPLGDRWSLWQDAKAAALYFANWHLIWDSREYFAEGSIPGPIEHWWSLAVEEQFYFLWPLLLMFVWWGLARSSQRARRALPVAICVLLVASLVSSLAFTTPNGYFRYYATFTRAYHLLAGALVAVLVARRVPAQASKTLRVLGSTLAGASLVWLVWLAATIDGAAGYPGTAGLAVTAASTGLVVALTAFPAGAFHRLLGARPLAAMGRLSYSLYLWHWPVIVFVPLLAVRTGVPGGRNPVVLTALTFACAAFSYLVVERPIRFNLWPAAPAFAVVVAGLATSVAIAGVAGPVLVPGASGEQAIVTETVGPGRTAKISVSIGAIVAASRDIAASAPCPYWDPEWPADPAQSAPCVLRRGAGPKIAIAGDSHGQMWLPAIRALADRHDATLVVATRTACGWTSIAPAVTDERGHISERTWCTAWRDRHYQRIVDEFDPDLVFLGTRSHIVQIFEGDRRVPPSSAAEHRRLWRAGVERTVARFGSGGARVVALEALPTPQRDIPDCLSEHRDDAAACDFSASRDAAVRIYNRILRSVATDVERFDTVSLLDTVCPRGVCPSVIDGQITYRDDDHLSATFARSLMDEIEGELAATGILL